MSNASKRNCVMSSPNSGERLIKNSNPVEIRHLLYVCTLDNLQIIERNYTDIESFSKKNEVPRDAPKEHRNIKTHYIS